MISLALALSFLSLVVAASSWVRTQKVLGGTDVHSLKSLLKKHHLRQNSVHNDAEQIRAQLCDLEQRFSTSLHRVGFTRFNPHSDTGGNQSFAICLLDAKLNGLILTTVHGREGTRVYAKDVAKGQSKHRLSPEEEKVLAQAIEV